MKRSAIGNGYRVSALRRNYSAAYLAEIGGPGANLVPVRRGAALLRPTRLDVGLAISMTAPAPVPAVMTTRTRWVWRTLYGVDLCLWDGRLAVSASPSWRAGAGSSGDAPAWMPGCSGMAAAVAEGVWYGGPGDSSSAVRDCSLPASLAGGSRQAASVRVADGADRIKNEDVYVAEADYNYRYHVDEYAIWTLAVSAGPVWQPYWGATPAAADLPDGFDAGEGHWFAPFAATLSTETLGRGNHMDHPYLDNDGPFGHVLGASATATGWLVSDAAFHRIGPDGRSLSVHALADIAIQSSADWEFDSADDDPASDPAAIRAGLETALRSALSSLSARICARKHLEEEQNQ